MSGDPFVVLNLPHDPAVTGRHVRRAFRLRLRRVRQGAGRAGELARVAAAYAALRSEPQRRQMLVDLALQPGHWRTGDLSEVAAMVEAVVPPPEGPWDLEAAWDHAALARAAAALRVERAAAGEPRWPTTAVGWVWARLWYGRPTSLVMRVLLAAAVPLLAQLVALGAAAVSALAAGAASWLVVTGQHDLAPRFPRWH